MSEPLPLRIWPGAGAEAQVSGFWCTATGWRIERRKGPQGISGRLTIEVSESLLVTLESRLGIQASDVLEQPDLAAAIARLADVLDRKGSP